MNFEYLPVDGGGRVGPGVVVGAGPAVSKLSEYINIISFNMGKL